MAKRAHLNIDAAIEQVEKGITEVEEERAKLEQMLALLEGEVRRQGNPSASSTSPSS
jgi:prefoldin subunit 5